MSRRTFFSFLRQHRWVGTAGFGGSYSPSAQREKWEIHPVFPYFRTFACAKISRRISLPHDAVLPYLSSFQTKAPLHFKMQRGCLFHPLCFVCLFRISIRDFHNHFQTIGQFAAFQFVPADDGDSKLGSTVPCCGIALSG